MALRLDADRLRSAEPPPLAPSEERDLLSLLLDPPGLGSLCASARGMGTFGRFGARRQEPRFTASNRAHTRRCRIALYGRSWRPGAPPGTGFDWISLEDRGADTRRRARPGAAVYRRPREALQGADWCALVRIAGTLQDGTLRQIAARTMFYSVLLLDKRVDILYNYNHEHTNHYQDLDGHAQAATHAPRLHRRVYGGDHRPLGGGGACTSQEGGGDDKDTGLTKRPDQV